MATLRPITTALTWQGGTVLVLLNQGCQATWCLPPEECLCEAHVLPEVIQVQRPLSIHSDDDDDDDDVEDVDDDAHASRLPPCP